MTVGPEPEDLSAVAVAGRPIPEVAPRGVALPAGNTVPLSDEGHDAAARFWQRANAWFVECGITMRKVLPDNGACY